MSHFPPLAAYRLKNVCSDVKFCGWARWMSTCALGKTAFTSVYAALRRPVIWAGLFTVPIGWQMPLLISLPICTQAGVTPLAFNTLQVWNTYVFMVDSIWLYVMLAQAAGGCCTPTEFQVSPKW